MLQERSGGYRFGVPTRFDVEDTDFQQSIRIEELNDRIKNWNWPTSTMGLHNHIASAWRFSKTGSSHFSVERVYKNGIIDRGVDQDEFRKCLKPRLILDTQLKLIERFQRALEEAKPYLQDLESDQAITSSHRYETLPFGVSEEKIPEDKQKNGMKFKYTFKPLPLINSELQSLTQDLKSIEVEGNPVEAIHKIWVTLNRHDNNGVKDLAGMFLYISQKKSPFSYELDKETEAGRLHALNSEIYSDSDVAVRFDGRYLLVKEGANKTHMIPFEPLWKPELKSDGHALQMRISVRDSIMSLLEQKRSVMVQGVTITRNENGVLTTNVFDLPQWLVNAIGEPIIADNIEFRPENWRVEEISLVEQYRSISVDEALQVPFHPLVIKVVSTYTRFMDEGQRFNPEEITSDVLYGLRPDDWVEKFQPQTVVIKDRI